jgi:hypothetical protein
MKSALDNWLRSSGWIGIASRVICEVLFLMFVLNAAPLASLVEKMTSGRTLVISPQKELLLDRAATLLFFIGLAVEVVNIVSLLIAKRRSAKRAI